MGAQYTREQYTELLKNLLPPGRAWPREEGTNLHYLLYGLAAELNRIDVQANKLVSEAHPDTATELISEWETEMGFPDEIYTIPGTLQARRDQVKSRLFFSQDQLIPNKAFWIELGGNLGYTITAIDDEEISKPFEVGVCGAGDPIGDGTWDSVWMVYVDGSAADGAKLEAVFRRLGHSHLTVMFTYTS